MDRRPRASRYRWLLIAALLLNLPVLAQNQNVTVDDQPTTEQQLDEIKALQKAGRYDQAVELMQELIEGARFKLVGVEEGHYADAEQWCRALLLKDKVLRDTYRVRYTAAAARALEQAQAADDPIEALGAVYRQYTVTPSGLAAGLRLSGLLLESGAADSAVSLVDEMMRHPDREASWGLLLKLRGAAAAYTYQTPLVEDSATQLTELGKGEAAAWLNTLASSIHSKALLTRPALTDEGDKPARLKQALWTQPLAEARRATSWMLREVFVLPAVAESAVLINNGRQIVAMDRASGQRLWVYPPDDADNVVRPTSGARWYDGRSVAIGGGTVCGVLGECYGITDPRNPHVLSNKLTCVDHRTGKPKWERVSGALRENEPALAQDRRAGRVNLQHTHFVGTPVIARERVLALLRRSSTQGTQSTWLMCYDLADGTLLWYRHISLVSLSYSRDASKITPQLMLDGETLYLTDGIATAGAIDFQSGSYQWLRALPVGLGRSQRLTPRTRGVLSPPLMTQAGLLVALSLNREPLILLDPDDGSVLETFEGHPQLGDARYMLDAKGGAVIVSFNNVSYWDAMKAEVGWTFRLGPDEHTIGRGEVTLRYVVMPTNRRVVVLDRKTGKLIDQTELGEGNKLATTVLVRDGDLFAVHNSGLSLFAPWESVYQRLVKRVEQTPDDPTGGLALASLAIRQEGMNGAVLAGIGFALDAIGRQSALHAAASRKRVFAQLRALAPQAQASDLRSEIYDRMALVSETAGQEAAYHMDSGLFRTARGEVELAVDHFHAVLAEPAFASEPYAVDGVTRSSGVIAQEQLQALIDRYGRSVYARQDAMAQAWLAQLKADGLVDAAALMRIARRFPLSLAVVDVLIEAAQLSEAEGRRLEATGLYQQAVVRSTIDMQRQLAVGRLLAFYERQELPELALSLIEREQMRDPGLTPLADGAPMTLDAWKQRMIDAMLAPTQKNDPGPALGVPTLIAGQMIPLAPGVRPAAGSARLYLVHDDLTISCHHALDFASPVWSAATPGEVSEQLYLLSERPEQVLFWAAEDGVVFAMSPDGEGLLWSLKLPEAAPDNPGRLLGPRAVSRVLVSVSDTVVCFADREAAHVVAVERASGSVLWQTRLNMPSLTGIDSDGWTLAIAGPGEEVEQLKSGKAAVLDLFTGEPRHRSATMTLSLTPRAVRLVNGRLIIVGATAVAEIDPVSSVSLWQQQIPGTQLGTTAEVARHVLVVEGLNGTVLSLDTSASGQITGQVLLRRESDPDDITMHAAGGQVVVRGGAGMFCFGASPGVRWRDALAEPGLYSTFVLIGGEHVAMLAHQVPDAGRPSNLGVYLFDREGGRLVNRYLIAPSGMKLDTRRARLIGDTIVIPAGDRFMVIPSIKNE